MQTFTITVQRIAKPLFVSLLLLICSIITITCKATATPAAKSKSQTAKADSIKTAAAKADTLLSVTGISTLTNDTTTAKVKFEIFQTIKLTVKNLDKGLEKHKNDLSKIILYIDGNAVNGLHPVLVDSTTLQFDLKRIPENKENTDAWTAILSRGTKSWNRLVPVTVGFENDNQIPSMVKADLTVINRFWFDIYCVLILLAIILFIWLARNSDMIRDTGPQPKSLNDRGEPHRKPYSLARTQAACWFFVVIFSYVFIWMVMRNFSLNASVLVLTGISAFTALGSAAVDSSKNSDQEKKRKILEGKVNSNEVESRSLQSEITTLATNIASTPSPTNLEELKTELGSKQAELAAKKEVILQTHQQLQNHIDTTKPPVSKNFISDILSDDEGISFHRFQMFTWTIVLIVFFVWSVSHLLAMPEFDATLLGLMGISGGTYIGFKLPNQQG